MNESCRTLRFQYRKELKRAADRYASSPGRAARQIRNRYSSPKSSKYRWAPKNENTSSFKSAWSAALTSGGIGNGSSNFSAITRSRRRASPRSFEGAGGRRKGKLEQDCGTLRAYWRWRSTSGAGYPDPGQAYRKSLAIRVRLGNIAGQAGTLVQLGNLYGDTGRLEEAVAFYRQTADKYIEIQDVASEGRARNNVAITLRKLGRFDESRQEVLRQSNATRSSAMQPSLEVFGRPDRHRDGRWKRRRRGGG
jgi:tetratricopeptide (TPR) repeat protein